jgi:hypothetical protein
MNKARFCVLYFALGGSLLFAQSYAGSFDQASCGSISGWAWDGIDSDKINVDIYDGSIFVMSAAANLYRSDLPGKGIGAGYSAFNVPPPSTLKDNQIHNIYVKYPGTTTDLPADLGLSNVSRPLQCNSSSTGYTYYYTDSFTSINTSNWTQNGSVSILANWGLSATSSGGGSLISKVAVQGPSTTNYEVSTTLSLKQNGGYYVQYLRASSNALTGTGSYYSVELQNPAINSSGLCSATLAGFQSINGTVTQIYSMPVVCHDGMQLRTMVVGSIALTTLGTGGFTVALSSQLSTGMPGVGGRSMPSTNAILLAQLGPWDNIAPSAVNAQTFTPWLTSGMVHVEWQGAVDDANGRGIAYYYIHPPTAEWTSRTPRRPSRTPPCMPPRPTPTTSTPSTSTTTSARRPPSVSPPRQPMPAPHSNAAFGPPTPTGEARASRSIFTMAT